MQTYRLADCSCRYQPHNANFTLYMRFAQISAANLTAFNTKERMILFSRTDKMQNIDIAFLLTRKLVYFVLFSWHG